VAPHEGGIAARVILSLENAGSARAARDRTVQLADRNMLARKSSLIAVGGLNARFIDDGGDRDLSARMLAAGMTLGWCPAGFVWRSGHSTFANFCVNGSVMDAERRCSRSVRSPRLRSRWPTATTQPQQAVRPSHRLRRAARRRALREHLRRTR